MRPRPADRPAARPVVAAAALILLLAVAVLTDSEWWPVSSMRLFSGVRGPIATSWRVSTVTESGATQHLDFESLGRGFRGAHHLVPRMLSMTAAERDRICGAWADAAARAGQPRAVRMQVERVRTAIAPDGDSPPRLVDTRLEFECAT